MRRATWGPSRGQDIGILPGGWVVLGGRQFYLPSNVSGLSQPRNTSIFLQSGPNAVPMGAKGYPNVLELTKAHGRDAIPVWDAKGTLLFGSRGQPPVLCSGLGDLLTAETTAHPFDAAAGAKRYWNGGLRHSVKSKLPADKQRFVLPDKLKRSDFLTPLLAENAVIFLSRGGVTAVSRTDTTVLWNIRLPAQPVLGGLSMTRAGDVLVPLVDGRMVCIGAQ